MRSAGNFNSEWGYLAPAPSFMRTVRVVLVATAIGATAGAAVVLSLIDRPSVDHDGTASIAAHAIVTSLQAAPATAAPAPRAATATLTAPASMTAAVAATAAPTVPAKTPVPIAPQVTATVTPQPVTPQVALQSPPAVTPSVATVGATSVVTSRSAAQPQAPNVPLQPAVAVNPPAPEIPAVSDVSGAPAPKPASGFASLSDVHSATETAPAEASDQALIPPQTVPVKKPKPHAAYASNSKYQPTPGLGTVLRRLFSPHQGTSYYPNR
ncbi:MAG: hypothetical protein WBF24_07470 [Xanthobacteraceae bacterium]